MATAYTKFIEDGTVTTAKEFLQLCSRQFGIYDKSRDEPLSPEIPTVITKDQKFEDDIIAAKESLDEAIHETNWESRLADLISNLETEYNDYVIQYESWVNSYTLIREGVSAWVPTDVYRPIKTFAINQIDASVKALIKPDVYKDKWEAAQLLTAEQLKENTLKERSEILTEAIKASQKEDINIAARQKYLEGFLALIEDM